MAKIKGLNKVLKKLSKFGDEAQTIIAQTTQATAKDIVADARTFAPKDKGKLAQSITDEEVNKLTQRVVVNSSYGAYVEFGTGKKVSVPKDLQEQADKFRGGRSGTFEEGLQAIKDWCRGKGIDEKFAYPIFMSILRNGIAPQPYLYPAWVLGKREYVLDLKEDLKYLTKKYE
jgi:HK97 gp10 family phage protein